MKTPLAFDNRFVRELPGDPRGTNERRQVHGAAWSAVSPTPVATPTLLAHAREVAELVGFGPDDHTSPRFAEVFGGNALLTGMQPYAACYGGHQFGHWAGQLGDGRAISLGEVVNARGERWELQLKGAGPTPYSRTADGRAVLRSSIREFLCSEAMHHLGVPTTRALSVVHTGEPVMRDMFYDGNPQMEPGAVVCRVAPSFIRFGNFEIATARGDETLLRQLADFTIARDFPHIDAAAPARYAQWFREVCARTASMLVQWMRVGFVHGVMNTDNMSVLGLTIDYGPYGFLDDFDPHWTPNTTDAGGRRYRYANQPAIAQWNLERFADALRPLFADIEPLKDGLGAYVDRFNAEYRAMLATKFGFPDFSATHEALAQEGLGLLTDVEGDHTLFFRALTEWQGEVPQDDAAAVTALGDMFYDAAKRDAQTPAMAAWLRRWHAARHAPSVDVAATQAAMTRANPRFIPRNYLAQQAIDAATAGDASVLHDLLDTLRRPYDAQPGREAFAAKRPDWARHKAGCSMLSCSS
ncbi:YdiU family protein [Pseudogemmatithrix spongiicola]|uniref:Protein nucleotidyltransferase YdiU n=1 Tax=Pseudogemmatithrix spongiicola TaxID=3062599 RepID=A0AA49Q478_9BACT|nr:YdiU family protein [Gemmatimonadaceae bacterium 'strain 138']WKW14354.1 YdiU family protein [Gemmatimonadaceae bacterium 'strain 318']